MIITLKNKMQVTMDLLIKNEVEKVDGIPDKFLFSKKEMGQLLVELNKIGRIHNEVTFEGNNPPSALEIYRQKFTNESINALLNRWARNDFTVKFRDIPIVFTTKTWDNGET